MNIAVYCASSMPNNEEMILKTEELGRYIASNSHKLVYGGSSTGLMGIISKTIIKNNGKTIGVIPNIKLILERVEENLNEIIYTDDLSQRRNKMMELSDAFIALPGGPGTLDELGEIMCHIRIHSFVKPLIIYNIDHFYDDLYKQVEKFYEYDLTLKEDMEHVYFVSNINEINEIIKKYN